MDLDSRDRDLSRGLRRGSSPVTYIGAGGAGVISSFALSAALRRRALAAGATTVLAA